MRTVEHTTGASAIVPGAAPRYANGVDKPGLDRDPFGSELHEIVREAFERSDRANVPRKQVAQRLIGPDGKGLSYRTVESWLLPSRAVLIPLRYLGQLLFRENVLPTEVRQWMVGQMAARAGMVASALEEVDPEAAPPRQQVCEITAALGRVAGAVEAATGATSSLGEQLSAAEAREIGRYIDGVVREAVQLRASLRAVERGSGAGRGGKRV